MNKSRKAGDKSKKPTKKQKVYPSRPVRLLRSFSFLLLIVLIGLTILLVHYKNVFNTVGGTTKPSMPISSSSTTAPTTTTSTAPINPNGPFAVGLSVMNFTENRLIYPPHTSTGNPEPRVIVTYIRYPAVGSPGAGDNQGAKPEHIKGGYPLVVFAPGYDLVPNDYAHLLRTWARAGYVVAGVVFPLTNPNTPGGPYENDIVNQPYDISFVIQSLLKINSTPSNLLYNLINPSEIAVAGHSDGAETAMAITYDTCCSDSLIKAAIIMSGQELNLGSGSYYVPSPVPLLAVQGMEDEINPPVFTNQLYQEDPGTKYLLELLNAGHYSPYTTQTQAESVVGQVTTDFLNAYLKQQTAQISEMATAGEVPNVASFTQSS
ncbi:MAG: hypothetical protein M1483_07790 [Actinobacteria bacterium]|nr:hypothetical protein [Actinomycetota bacterium]MCL6105510.1 hypothetical protein [Actinomycetota bacterium]